MSKKISIRISIFIIILFLIVIDLILIHQKGKYKEFASDIDVEYGKLRLENYYLVNLILDHLEKKALSSFITVPDTIDFNSRNNNLFVWMYSKNTCTSCIEQEFSDIVRLSSQIGRENIAIIVAKPHYIQLNELLITYGLGDLKTIIINNENEGAIVNNENKTFYFVIDTLNNANMIFHPNHKLSILSEKYFEKIIDKYFDPL
jgi:hypothetical protein